VLSRNIKANILNAKTGDTKVFCIYLGFKNRSTDLVLIGDPHDCPDAFILTKRIMEVTTAANKKLLLEAPARINQSLSSG